MQLKKKMPWLILLAASSLPVLWILFLVEDWKRDLTTNIATTDATAEDPARRPLESPLPPEAQAARIVRFVEANRNWKVASIEPASSEGTIRLHLIRTTTLLRFKDDVHVVLTSTPRGGSVLEATSRSRVGKGDLGQNPRNLRELIQTLAEKEARSVRRNRPD